MEKIIIDTTNVDKPHFSLLKFVKYRNSKSAAERKRLIKEQKYQHDLRPIVYYNTAKNAIMDYLWEESNELLIQKSLAKLNSIPEGHKKDNCLKAFNLVREDVLKENFEKYSIVKGKNSSAFIELSGVKISVRPELILKDKVTGVILGGIKLYFVKDEPLEENIANGITTLVHYYIKNKLHDSENILTKNCFVYDVFQQTLFKGPKATKAIIKDLNNVAEEISGRWTSI